MLISSDGMSDTWKLRFSKLDLFGTLVSVLSCKALYLIVTQQHNGGMLFLTLVAHCNRRQYPGYIQTQD